MTDPLYVNWGCGPLPAPKPWINIDRRDIPQADRIAEWPAAAYPRNSIDRLYLGHVLEHIPYDHDLPLFLEECLAVLKPGGHVAVVGPDIWRTLVSWKNGRQADDFVMQVLEDARGWMTGAGPSEPGARHQWNCYPERVVGVMVAAGFVDVAEQDLEPVALDWPVVAVTGWQFAVTARKADA